MVSRKIDAGRKMLAVTQSTYAVACGGLTLRLVSMRFAGLPYTRRGKSRLYALADVLPGVKKKYLSAVPALFENAADDGQSYTGGDESLPRARALESWLLEHVPGAAERLHNVRTSFFDGLSRAMRSSGLTGDVERLRMLVIRADGPLRYIVTGDTSGLPVDRDAWAVWARHFSLLHSSRSPLLSEIVTGEAA
jgi:hypothetical protein